MSTTLVEQQNYFISHFDVWLSEYFENIQKNNFANKTLLESQKYSLLSGGKRFRPFLCYLVSKVFSAEDNKIKNISLAIEFIHTYSLIHDDLPCMDNDDFRRGKPTNHKVFGEAFALLAGDGLLTDAFGVVAADPNLNIKSQIEILKLQSQLTGSFGMVSGQMFDMQAIEKLSLSELERIHILKTANLIQYAALAGAYAADANTEQINLVSEFSNNLGMAFQIKDDLLDAENPNEKFKNYVQHVGVEKTKTLLDEYSNKALVAIKSLNLKTTALEQLIDYNIQRKA